MVKYAFLLFCKQRKRITYIGKYCITYAETKYITYIETFYISIREKHIPPDR